MQIEEKNEQMTVETNNDEVTVKTESKFKPKKLSLVAKVIACTQVIVCHFLMWTGVLTNASSAEICACGFTILGIFGTVDINLALDKFSRNYTR